MLVCCWSVKGGSGVSVVAAGIAMGAVGRRPATLVDLQGDAEAVLAVPAGDRLGVADWLGAGPDVPPDGFGRLARPIRDGLDLVGRGDGDLTATPARCQLLAEVLATRAGVVVVDLGVLGSLPAALSAALLARAAHSLLVIRPCYLALRRFTEAGRVPSGVVLLEEAGRALTAADVAEVVGAPVVARVPTDPAIARAVDAGLLSARRPRALRRSLRGVLGAPVQDGAP